MSGGIREFGLCGTALPEILPSGLAREFDQDPAHHVQWRAFIRRTRLPQDTPVLGDVVGDLRTFVTPIFGPGQSQSLTWVAGGPWK